VWYPHGTVDVVLLDLYDTIAWTDWDAHAHSVAARLGVSLRRLLAAYDETREVRGSGRLGSMAADLGALAVACGLSLQPPLLAELAAAAASELVGNVHLYDDTLPVLRRLRSAGTRLAIISNCDFSTRPVVDALGLEREVDAVLLSCEVGSHKPDRAIFEAALARVSARPAECVFVDDQPRYLDGAAALGIRTYRMLRGPVEPEDRAGPHPVITTLTDL
jgi:HAD superfamily hydrolase (TIGR01509 family)